MGVGDGLQPPSSPSGSGGGAGGNHGKQPKRDAEVVGGAVTKKQKAAERPVKLQQSQQTSGRVGLHQKRVVHSDDSDDGNDFQ
jgi:hypothetical protein